MGPNGKSEEVHQRFQQSLPPQYHRKDYQETAVNPDHNLVLAVRKRRLRYLGHILRMEPGRLVRDTLCAYVNGGVGPLLEGSLLMDCEEREFNELALLAQNRAEWERRVQLLT